MDEAIGRVRAPAESVGATQFEVLTAAALTAFGEAEVDVAVVEAGLGGRFDATNVLRSPVQVLTNVALEHTEVLGETRREIAAEKLAVVQAGATVVLGESEWAPIARDRGAGSVVVVSQSNLALARAAVEEFLGRSIDGAVGASIQVPGRLERYSDAPLEIRDGAHNLAGIGYLLPRLPSRRYVIVASILADKDVDGMLAALSVIGGTLVATSSSNARAVPAERLAELARSNFASVEVAPEPAAA